MNDPISVAQFNEMINLQVSSLGSFDVVGEVTEKRITRNSGLMMTIKDENQNAVLKLSGFAPRVRGINSIEVGMKVVATGVPQFYSPFGSFTLQLVSIVPHGEGSLKAAFEKLKALLEQKGYFAPERKRKLPEVITKIALVTADQSAAQTDFLKILSETQTGLDIDFYPVTVQGKNAVPEILEAIAHINAIGEDYDCIVLTRGGGSLEDLIAFNAEEVAGAVFASKIPVLSAVGHERDTSISDLVADVVASTPSQAAYYLADINNLYLQSIEELLVSIGNVLQEELRKYDFGTELSFAKQRILGEISKLDFESELKFAKSRIDREYAQIVSRVANVEKLLDAYNPQNVLERGYALVRKGSKVVTSIKQVKVGAELRAQLSDGEISTQVTRLAG